MPDDVLAPQFENMTKQRDAARLGMWAFLGSEALLFAGLFGLYATYRALYPQAFGDGVTHNDATIGTINTFILLTSSFTVALSVHEIRAARARRAALLLLVSIVLALAFLTLKMTEYAEHFREGIYPGANYRYAALPGYGAQMFFTLYFLTTGLHAFHVTAGGAVLTWLMIGCWQGAFSPTYHTPLELGALYWHLVDIIWIFLWPCLYLMHR